MKTKILFTATLFIAILFSFTNCEEIETLTPEETQFGTVKDYQGNEYSTIKINNQWWMNEDLKSTKYNDGTDIPNIENYTLWSNMNFPGYCWPINNPTHLTYPDTVYGVLYNWYVIETEKTCPEGWHVPSVEEWNGLINYIGAYLPFDNDTLFNWIGGGYRNQYGDFEDIGLSQHWWSSSEISELNATSININKSNSLLVQEEYKKTWGFNIRCVKD